MVVVDVVTTRRADLHADILELVGAGPPSVGSSLTAVSYRAGPDQLQAWPASLELGRPLPVLPLWLAPDQVVRLDLEVSYATACDDVAIRRAG